MNATLAALQHTSFALAVSCAIGLTLGCGENKTHPKAAGADAAVALSCVPNLDGVIERSEVPTVLDVPVSYLVNPVGAQRTVDLVGAVASTGEISWDFGTSFADDVPVTIAAAGVTGAWFEGSFPDGDFVTPLDREAKTLGVYHATGDALLLLGLVSAHSEPAAQKTLLVYDPPVVALQYPLRPGLHWSSTGTIRSGTLNGQPYNGSDRYDVNDDAIGGLTLHDFVFDQVHRVRTTVTVTPSAGVAVVSKQVSFLGECFGEIVHVEAASGEAKSDFTSAATLRQLSP